MTAGNTMRSVVRTIREENVPFKAASIAYYALASFLPLLVLLLSLLSVIGATRVLIEAFSSTVTGEEYAILERLATRTQGRQVAGLLGLLLTLWSGSKVFRGLTIAFEEVYDTGADLSLLDRIARSLVVTVVLIAAFVFLASTTVVLGLEQLSVQYPVVIGNLIATALIAVALFPFYYVLSPVSTTLRHALPGTVVAAVGLVSLQVAFFYVLHVGGGYTAYGLLSAVLLFITFLYFGTNALLIGAVINDALDW